MIIQFNINIKSINPKLFKDLYKIFRINCIRYNFKLSNIISLPIKKNKITLLKGPHIHKTAREQFEKKIHKNKFIIKNKNKDNFYFWKKKTKQNHSFFRDYKFMVSALAGIQCKLIYKFIY